MGNFELSGTLKTLRQERNQLQNELRKLDKAIATIQELAGASASNGQARKRTLSPSARRRIAKAQKIRWAKFRQQRAAKS